MARVDVTVVAVFKPGHVGAVESLHRVGQRDRVKGYAEVAGQARERSEIGIVW